MVSDNRQRCASAGVLELLLVIRNLLPDSAQAQLEAATTWLQTAAAPQVCGVGALTSQVLERGDTGLELVLKTAAKVAEPDRDVSRRACFQRILKIRNGPITRHGNPGRIRHGSWSN